MDPKIRLNWVKFRSMSPSGSRLGRLAGLMLFLTLGWVVSCGKPGVGDTCKADADCPSGLCLGQESGFPDGYCSQDCTTAACEGGQSCGAVSDDGPLVCLAGCQSADDCKSGSQCYKGACQPHCQIDSDCGDDGYSCDGGSCTARPGSPMGSSCAGDSDCSSQNCLNSQCVQGCDRETACASGQTCVLDRTATRLRGTCQDQRSAALRMPLNGCDNDSDCVRGSCVMGLCLIMCQHPHDCGAAPEGKSCADVPAPLTKLTDDQWPHMKSCLPQNQTVAVPLNNATGIQKLLVPSTARSVTLVMSADNDDPSIHVGLSFFQDDKKTLLFGQWNPADPNGYFDNIIRHQPDAGSSVFLMSASPTRAPIRTSAYTFEMAATDAGGGLHTPSLLAIYKLFDQPILRGKVPLRVHITDLSGLPSTCVYSTVKANNAPTVLAPMIAKLQEIYGQGTVGVTFDPISFVDSDAPTSLDANQTDALGQILAAASKQTVGGGDLTLIRGITPVGILGIAGGIPGAPGIQGNPRTGAVMSMGFLCMSGVNYGLTQLAQTAAHELGHTLGLNHNRESNGMTDPLGDGSGLSESAQQDAANLMYWQSTDMPGESLTTEQGQVIRSVPQIQP